MVPTWTSAYDHTRATPSLLLNQGTISPEASHSPWPSPISKCLDWTISAKKGSRGDEGRGHRCIRMSKAGRGVGKRLLDPSEAAATFDLALHIGDLELLWSCLPYSVRLKQPWVVGQCCTHGRVGMVESLIWFWLIDETHWTNSWVKCVDKIGWSKPSGGARWSPWRWRCTCDDGDQAPTWKEERKIKTQGWSRQKYQIGFCFGTQNTIEDVSVFRIDSRTMKREKSWFNRLSSATRCCWSCLLRIKSMGT